MTGKKTYKEVENEAKLGTKKYIRRKAEEEEAEKEIEQYEQEQDTKRIDPYGLNDNLSPRQC